MPSPKEFRTAKLGYDPDDVAAHIAHAERLVAELESRLFDVDRRIRVATAAVHDGGTAVPDDVDLIAVIQAGERAGDEVVAQAEAAAARLRDEAQRRIEALRDDADLRALAAQVAQARAAAERVHHAVVGTADGLDTVAAGVTRARSSICDGLTAVLGELATLAPAHGERR